MTLPVYGNGRIVATKKLKESGQADVFRGKLTQRDGSQKEVAIKVFHKTEDWHDCKLALMALLRISGHPNVMEVWDFFEVPKPASIMRFVSGGDLRDHLDTNGRFAVREAKLLLQGIGEGLKHLHEHSLVHRDLKSPNVLLEKSANGQYNPVLIDLGMGKVVTESASQFQTTAMKGTPVWMAPEMISDNKWSTKTDIYALGIIAWEVLSGDLPYSDKGNLMQLLAFVLVEHGRPDMSKLAAVQVPDEWQNFIKRMWAPSPSERPSSEEVLSVLEALPEKGLPLPTTPSYGYPETGRSSTPPSLTGTTSKTSEITDDVVDLFVKALGGMFAVKKDSDHTKATSSTQLARNMRFTDPCGFPSLYTGYVDAQKRPDGIGVCRYTKDYTQAYYGHWSAGNIIKEGLFHMPKVRVRHFGCWNVGKFCGFGVLSINGSFISFGSLDGNYVEGHGMRIYKDGMYYVGYFANNSPSGYGTLYTRTGEVKYQGAWSNGKPDRSKQSCAISPGTFILRTTKRISQWNQNYRYTGYMNPSGAPQGWGLIEVGDDLREVHFGQWKEGALDGVSLRTFVDGRWYVGEWNDQHMHGNGVLVEANESVYIGEMQRGSKTGRGWTIADDGSVVYEGSHVEGKWTGHGILYDSMSGRVVFNGDWKDSIPQEDDLLIL